MKRILLVLAICLYCPFSLAGPIPTIELFWKGKATPFYGDASEEQQQKLLNVLRNIQMAERMATVASGFRLHHDINVGFESCGTANAFFAPQRQSIVICTEFIELIIREAKSDQELVAHLQQSNFSNWINGVIWGVFLHELGHALVHVNRIGITGREEDVADQFFLWYAVNFVDLSKQPIITPVVWFWGAMSKKRDLAGMPSGAMRQVLANEHSLDDQRTYNVACWALGANPVMGGRTAQFVGLPESRAVRCPGEYAQINSGMRALFVKYVKLRRN